ncbi:hypothetical protein OII53_10330 [Achromobacter ruhlandii]|uniref:hypothetical protein n=1 Tax=Achromobacter ruhlandii TaxID=72557 RepID=UPI0021F112B3|nr:hypothetical protein [Achromobacter ruhlandii]MCV6797672.1 hypothetical protein [Achromobacter ruhlandii]MCV6804822.1 hypothetical protein [Achromobacter ruhlandii]MCV6809691.1 hypothetical protein [Achromobacter ruhlandii]MCV6818925.1 hypothetical protein [Achromobacter ruhlandii]
MSDDTPAIEASASQLGNLMQFLIWVAERPRTYADIMEAWRTSCPRLSAWEDATSNGLVDLARRSAGDAGTAVATLTPKGRAWLAARQAGMIATPRQGAGVAPLSH